MAGEYYDHSTYPGSNASGSSAAMRAELELIEAGFNKLPTLAGNAGEIVVVNLAGDALGSIAAGLTTEILVGGGAGAFPVWTAASGSGAPVRATSPTLTTPTLTTPAMTGGTSSGMTFTTATLTAPTLTTPVLGTPASGNLSSCTADGTNAVGFKELPQNSKSAAYTCVLADSGKHILHPAADTTARNFTIPANASVAYPVGTVLTFVNQNAAGTISILITSDTMRLAGAGTAGTRTLAANGIATAIKITTTEWLISGSGLT